MAECGYVRPIERGIVVGIYLQDFIELHSWQSTYSLQVGVVSFLSDTDLLLLRNYGRLTAKISILSHGCARPDVYVTAR